MINDQDRKELINYRLAQEMYSEMKSFISEIEKLINE